MIILFYFYNFFLVPGVIGTLQALEAIKIAVGIKCILIYREKDLTFERTNFFISLDKNKPSVSIRELGRLDSHGS